MQRKYTNIKDFEKRVTRIFESRTRIERNGRKVWFYI